MFKSSQNLRLAAEMRALERVARPWRQARRTWFDGTPESIEARLAATERVLSYARSGMTTSHLALTREAAAARSELLAAQHRLLTDFLDDGARAFRGSKRVASELNWDDEDPELARLREETGWDEDGDSDVHPNAREDVPDPGLLSNFDKFVQSGEIPSADAMREDIARWTGKEGSRRVAERGLRECINCGGALSGEEDDDKESECLTCGMSAHHKGVDWRRKSHRTAVFAGDDDNWPHGYPLPEGSDPIDNGDGTMTCPNCGYDEVKPNGWSTCPECEFQHDGFFSDADIDDDYHSQWERKNPILPEHGGPSSGLWGGKWAPRPFESARLAGRGEDQWIDCPHCGAEATPREWAKTGELCPTCSKHNYELHDARYYGSRRTANCQECGDTVYQDHLGDWRHDDADEAGLDEQHEAEPDEYDEDQADNDRAQAHADALRDRMEMGEQIMAPKMSARTVPDFADELMF